mmetsp:Transcript_2200/g.5176  ORF Transcript_2200/g.5176 Transcript_2200/m.5176 type:complete len:288 (-) Transcript_2200:211-1074(-)|eukprot:CAMPEP_0178995634 /NCGR_PEP_ID=MMETSP0795-20121207/7926_1 /TAXON_ID=88552 /ORGANISM="Amoebophrya sp., Strain Ameob2" /LENGTH=287 /DNA_ID=CAMNT_0020687943 /DNA_START=69 /DNA_END=932 /DNA_ORIENTATION=+
MEEKRVECARCSGNGRLRSGGHGRGGWFVCDACAGNGYKMVPVRRSNAARGAGIGSGQTGSSSSDHRTERASSSATARDPSQIQLEERGPSSTAAGARSGREVGRSSGAATAGTAAGRGAGPASTHPPPPAGAAASSSQQGRAGSTTSRTPSAGTAPPGRTSRSSATAPPPTGRDGAREPPDRGADHLGSGGGDQGSSRTAAGSTSAAEPRRIRFERNEDGALHMSVNCDCSYIGKVGVVLCGVLGVILVVANKSDAGFAFGVVLLLVAVLLAVGLFKDKIAERLKA